MKRSGLEEWGWVKRFWEAKAALRMAVRTGKFRVGRIIFLVEGGGVGAVLWGRWGW